MNGRSRSWIRACGLLLLHFSAGCASLATIPKDHAPQLGLTVAPVAPAICSPAPAAQSNAVLAVSAASEATPASPATRPDAFAGMQELTPAALVEQVLARNPSLAEMVAAWQAASARYPQVTSLEDPMLMGKIAPADIGHNPVSDDWYTIEVSQKLPFPGKLRLRGENALAEASAAGHQVDDMRLQLIESARAAFYEYYLVGRALAVNKETLERLQEFREAAAALYKTPPKDRKVSYQDVIQADVEIGRQQERQLTLERMRKVAVARINTLMNLPPNSPLPPPPEKAVVEDLLPDEEALRSTALARRPDLLALADRIRAEEAALALAEKEFYPDFEVAAGYDAFWDKRPQRPEINVRMNVTLYREKRRAAVREAQARIAQRRSELDKQIDLVNFQVGEAYAQVRENAQAVQLFEKKILPDAELNEKTARKDYETGLVPAVSMIEAERTRLNLYDRYYEVIADYFRRRATLERAIGGPLTP